MAFQDRLSCDIDKMAEYPSGGWDQDSYYQFYAWSLHLKKLLLTKSLHDAMVLLLDMNAQLERVIVPEEMEDEESKDDPPSAVSHPFVPFQPPTTGPPQMLHQPPVLSQSPVLAGRTCSGGNRGGNVASVGNVPSAAPPVAASSSSGSHIKSKPTPELVSSPDPVSPVFINLSLT